MTTHTAVAADVVLAYARNHAAKVSLLLPNQAAEAVGRPAA
jgi:hypothetical protein